MPWRHSNLGEYSLGSAVKFIRTRLNILRDKVTRTVSKILDVLAQKNLLLHKGPSDNRSSSERKPLDNRARVVQELVDTERKYVQDLETLQEYMKELEADEVLGKDQIHILFANLNGLVDFQRRFLIRVETQNDQPFEKQQWGMLFVEYVGFQALLQV